MEKTADYIAQMQALEAKIAADRATLAANYGTEAGISNLLAAGDWGKVVDISLALEAQARAAAPAPTVPTAPIPNATPAPTSNTSAPEFASLTGGKSLTAAEMAIMEAGLIDGSGFPTPLYQPTNAPEADISGWTPADRRGPNWLLWGAVGIAAALALFVVLKVRK